MRELFKLIMLPWILNVNQNNLNLIIYMKTEFRSSCITWSNMIFFFLNNKLIATYACKEWCHVAGCLDDCFKVGRVLKVFSHLFRHSFSFCKHLFLFRVMGNKESIPRTLGLKQLCTLGNHVIWPKSSSTIYSCTREVCHRCSARKCSWNNDCNKHSHSFKCTQMPIRALYGICISQSSCDLFSSLSSWTVLHF